MRGRSYCDVCQRVIEAKCPDGHQLPIIGLTVDVIVEQDDELALIRRRGDGWALPGGFVEYDESLEVAAMREVREELGADRVQILAQLHTFGDPHRDQGRRNVSVVYTAVVDHVVPFAKRSELAQRQLQQEGIEDVRMFPIQHLPELAFDHRKIVDHYLTAGDSVKPHALEA